MNFSLFLNSRSRPDLLKNFLKSVHDTAYDKNSIEVLVRYDHDDDLTRSISKENFNLNVRFIEGPRPDNLTASYNQLIKQAHGKNLFVCNDDVGFLTKNWDQIALNKISTYLSENEITDDIYYCWTSCNSADRDIVSGYCSFPIISKKATDIIGFFMYEDFKTLGADASIYRLYKKIGRIIYIKEIEIDHVLHKTIERIVSPDEVASEYRKKFFSNPINASTFDISKEVKILNDYINENSKYKFFE
jgi:hypothetical protein